MDEKKEVTKEPKVELKKSTKTKVVEEPKHSTESILNSKRFTFAQKCLLKSKLDDSKNYSIAEVDLILDRELKRKVT